MNRNQMVINQNPFNVLSNIRLVKSPEPYVSSFQNRSTYGRQLNSHKQALSPLSIRQKMYTDPPAYRTEKKNFEKNTTAELKASRDTTNTMTDSEVKPSARQTQSKNTIRTEEIGNLLSEFKTKFAMIQQKYSLPIKPSDNHTCLNYQPKTPQNTSSFQSRFDNTINKLFLETSQIPTSRTPTVNSKQNLTFTDAAEHPSWSIKKPGSLLLMSPQKKQNQTVSPTVDSRSDDKNRFRATFGPTKCNTFEIPVRKIREAEEAISSNLKFQKCKDVESETQENEEQDQTRCSIVLQKYSSGFQKLKRTQTHNTNLQSQETYNSNCHEALKRIRSLQGNPFLRDTNN